MERGLSESKPVAQELKAGIGKRLAALVDLESGRLSSEQNPCRSGQLR